MTRARAPTSQVVDILRETTVSAMKPAHEKKRVPTDSHKIVNRRNFAVERVYWTTGVGLVVLLHPRGPAWDVPRAGWYACIPPPGASATAPS